MNRYEQYLDDVRKCGIKKGVMNGIKIGITYFLIYCIYMLGIVINFNYTVYSHYCSLGQDLDMDQS